MGFGQEPIRQNWFNLTIYLYQYHVLPLYAPIGPVDSMFSFTGLSLTNVLVDCKTKLNNKKMTYDALF